MLNTTTKVYKIIVLSFSTMNNQKTVFNFSLYKLKPFIHHIHLRLVKKLPFHLKLYLIQNIALVEVWY